NAFGKGPSNEPAAQREWLKSRERGCADSTDPQQCLSSIYAERNEELALAVLFTHPDIALPELQRLNPEAAPLFEAIYVYARSAKVSDRDRKGVAALLEPYASKAGDGESWGESSPAEATKNDDAFAEFVGIRSAYLRHDVGGRAFPCAAAVRKPDLVDA